MRCPVCAWVSYLDSIMRQWSLHVSASWGTTHLCGWQNRHSHWGQLGNTHKDRTDQGCISHFCARLARLSHLFPPATWDSHCADEKTKAQSIHDLSRWCNQRLRSSVRAGLSDYKVRHFWAHFSILLSVKLSLPSCHPGGLVVPQPSPGSALEASYLLLLCLIISPSDPVHATPFLPLCPNTTSLSQWDPLHLSLPVFFLSLLFSIKLITIWPIIDLHLLLLLFMVAVFPWN